MEDNSTYVAKADMMFFQNEVLSDLKNIESTVNTKISKLSENTSALFKGYNQKFDEISNKIKDLLELITVTKIGHEKVEELYRNKDKIKDQINENRARIFQNKKIIDGALYKYDRAIMDNLEVPGLIGLGCKYNTIKQFLEFANGELNTFKMFKNQQSQDVKVLKERFDKFHTKIEISNKDVIQRCEVMYNNKIDLFKQEMEKKIENKMMLALQGGGGKPNFESEKFEEEIKKNNELINKTKEEMKKEIDDIIKELKKNKEMINADYIIVTKQKEECESLKQQINQINEDIKKLKQLKNDEDDIANNKINIFKSNKKLNNSNSSRVSKNKENNKKNLIFNNAQKLASSPNLFKLKNKNVKNLNDDIKLIIANDNQNKPNILSNINNNRIKTEVKIPHLDFRSKKKLSTMMLFPKNNKNRKLFIENDNSNNSNEKKRLNENKKRLSLIQVNNLNLEQNESNRNIKKNLLELSYESFSSSNDKEDNNDHISKTEKKNKNNDEKLINEQVNSTIAQNIDNNKKDITNVSKLIKMKSIEKPVKLNLIIPEEKKEKEKEKKDNQNSENLKSNENNENDNSIQKIKEKEKKLNSILSINLYNKSKIQSKKNNNINLNINSDTNEGSHRNNINLTEREVVQNYLNNIIVNKDNSDTKSISKALQVQNYKEILTSPIREEIKAKNIHSINDICTDNGFSFDENNFSSNEINFNLFNSPFNRNKSIKTYNKFYNTRNNFDLKSNKLINGFLTSIPIKSLSQNEQEEENVINKKIIKINNKINKFNVDTKTIINRLNNLELHFKPLNSQINEIIMIMYLLYEYLKKKNTDNKLTNDLLNNTNIKIHFKDIKFKGQKSILSFKRAKNYLYSTSGVNLEEGGLYNSNQTKDELEIILKKIEPFLIKQFKGTI